jgi:hypothetical protein
MLHLPNVTLVAVDTTVHELTALALRDTLARVSFGEVLVFSDKDLGIPGCRNLPCAASSNKEAQEFVWYGATDHIRTSHALFIQWDGWVVDPSFWSDRLLSYDFIGAIWPWYDSLRVGNGGFSLRSLRLLKLLASRRDMFPFGLPEDSTLCRTHRIGLEVGFGMRWASEDDAMRFGYEHGPYHESFGFHGLWNMARYLPENEIIRRLRLIDPLYLCNRPDLTWLQMVGDGRGYDTLSKAVTRIRGGEALV